MAAKRRLLEIQPTGLRTKLLFAVVILIGCAGRSEAQMGMGGIGIGFGFENPKTETNFLNTWSLQNAAAAAANRPQNLTAPKFQVRDEGLTEKYDPETRAAMINRTARNPKRELRLAGLNDTKPSVTTTNVTPAAVAQPKPRPVVQLNNFFDKSERLVWPSDAPINTELRAKRDLADQAILIVRNEYELQGIARLANVSDARQKLLDYGRPALDYARRQSTPIMAESFHSFLLGLYDNIGLAATTPRAK